jgi:hypothetical protein
MDAKRESSPTQYTLFYCAPNAENREASEKGIHGENPVNQSREVPECGPQNRRSGDDIGLLSLQEIHAFVLSK